MRKSTLVLSCAVVAMSSAAIWLWTQWQGAHSAILDHASHFSAHECLGTPASAPTTGVSGAAPTVVPAAMPPGEVRAAAPPLPTGFRPASNVRLIKDPEFRKAMRSRQRLEIDDELRDLPKVLGLSPVEANRLFDLMADQGVRNLEAQWEKPEEGKSRQDAYRETRARNDAELTDLLGASNMIRFQEFRSSLQGRAEVNSVRSELSQGPEPLRADQVDSMLAVVNPELQRMNQEIRDLGPRGPTGSDPAADAKRVELTVAANQRILDAARPILTSAQLVGLEELYRRQRLQMEAEGTIARMEFATPGK